MTQIDPRIMTATIQRALPEQPPHYTSRAPFDDRRLGAAAVYCSDGRFGEQMDEFLHDGLLLPRYDRVAIPGGAACLAGHTATYHEKNALARQLDFLIRAHDLRRIVLIAHDGCAFYRDVWLGQRTIKQQQAADLEKASAHLRSIHSGIEIESFFARRSGQLITFDRWTG